MRLRLLVTKEQSYNNKVTRTIVADWLRCDNHRLGEICCCFRSDRSISYRTIPLQCCCQSCSQHTTVTCGCCRNGCCCLPCWGRAWSCPRHRFGCRIWDDLLTDGVRFVRAVILDPLIWTTLGALVASCTEIVVTLVELLRARVTSVTRKMKK